MLVRHKVDHPEIVAHFFGVYTNTTSIQNVLSREDDIKSVSINKSCKEIIFHNPDQANLLIFSTGWIVKENNRWTLYSETKFSAMLEPID